MAQYATGKEMWRAGVNFITLIKKDSIKIKIIKKIKMMTIS